MALVANSGACYQLFPVCPPVHEVPHTYKLCPENLCIANSFGGHLRDSFNLEHIHNNISHPHNPTDISDPNYNSYGISDHNNYSQEPKNDRIQDINPIFQLAVFLVHVAGILLCIMGLSYLEGPGQLWRQRWLTWCLQFGDRTSTSYFNEDRIDMATKIIQNHGRGSRSRNEEFKFSSGDEIVKKSEKSGRHKIKEVHSINTKEGEWVRPLGNLETFMAVGGEYGSFNTAQAIWLSSPEPIKKEDVFKALTILSERSKVLQLTVSWRGFQQWFQRRSNLPLDFEVINGNDIAAVLQRLLHTPYNMSGGPLWRARLVYLNQDAPSTQHEAVLVFSIQHCVTDGATNMLLCRDAVEALNSVITGSVCGIPIRDVIPAISDQLTKRKDWLYILSYFFTKSYQAFIKGYNRKLYFNYAIPAPSTEIALTRILHEQYTVETTELLLKHCKSAGVTVHSCIMAAANLAKLQLVKQRAKVEIDAVPVNVINCINMRRYFPPIHKDSLGCHISLEENELMIHSSDGISKDKFWSLARRIGEQLHKSVVKERYPVKNCPLFRVSTIMIHINYELTRRAMRNCSDSHIVTTNMGNLKHLLPAKYDNGPVEITNLLRSVSIELSGNGCTLTFHTFLNRFMISLDYYTNKMTDDVAKQYFTFLTENITHIARTGSVDPKYFQSGGVKIQGDTDRN